MSGSSHARLAALVLVAGLTGSCRSPDDAWTFRATRAAWSLPEKKREKIAEDLHGSGESGVYLVAFVFLALPLAIDLVCLPVALTHDLCRG